EAIGRIHDLAKRVAHPLAVFGTHPAARAASSAAPAEAPAATSVAARAAALRLAGLITLITALRASRRLVTQVGAQRPDASDSMGATRCLRLGLNGFRNRQCDRENGGRAPNDCFP